MEQKGKKHTKVQRANEDVDKLNELAKEKWRTMAKKGILIQIGQRRAKAACFCKIVQCFV